MISHIVGKEHLTAVINEVCMDGRHDRVAIKEDFYGTRLFDLRCSDMSLQDIADRDSFTDVRNSVLLDIDPAHHGEMPSHDHLRSALHSSLILPPLNIDEVVDVINRSISNSRRRQGFRGQEAVSIDSNLAYKRLLSRLLLERSKFGIVHDNPKDLMVTLSKVSIRELSSASNNKLDRRRNPGGLRRSLAGRCFAEHLVNRPTLRAVQALNALAEHANIRDSFTYYEVDEAMPEVFDSEQADEYIVRELASHFRRGQMDQVFLTADESMSALLYGERMEHVVVRYPKEVPRSLPASPWLLRELLYDLTLSFRCIHLDGTGISLMGVWDGKNSDDYIGERICICIAEGSRIGQHLERDLRILRRLKESDSIDLSRLR